MCGSFGNNTNFALAVKFLGNIFVWQPVKREMITKMYWWTILFMRNNSKFLMKTGNRACCLNGSLIIKKSIHEENKFMTPILLRQCWRMALQNFIRIMFQISNGIYL